MKVVINRCYGGFGLSERAMVRLEELGCERRDYEVSRDDPFLVRVVEELGSELASGDCARLKVVEIPDGTDWNIQGYDGMECVCETHRTWE